MHVQDPTIENSWTSKVQVSGMDVVMEFLDIANREGSADLSSDAHVSSQTI